MFEMQFSTKVGNIILLFIICLSIQVVAQKTDNKYSSSSDKAIKNYEKAVELNPNFVSSLDALRKLKGN